MTSIGTKMNSGQINLRARPRADKSLSVAEHDILALIEGTGASRTTGTFIQMRIDTTKLITGPP